MNFFGIRIGFILIIIIKYIYINLKIPIFFICTRARTEEISQNFKE